MKNLFAKIGVVIGTGALIYSIANYRSILNGLATSEPFALGFSIFGLLAVLAGYLGCIYVVAKGGSNGK